MKKEFFDALEKGDEDEATKFAEYMNRIRTTQSGLDTSIRNKIANKNYDSTDFVMKAERIFYQGQLNNINNGLGSNPWAYKNTSSGSGIMSRGFDSWKF